ncbi:zinc ion binding [Tyrophagus putrescentiae]|nr:zinc ion binding [Tyrophagus putrescentiae]
MQTAHLVKRCRVCGDLASGFNYNGNLSCESCKCRMERCLENGMRRKKKKNSFREDNNPADKDSDEDLEAEESNSTKRRHSVMSSLANSSSSPGSTSPAASETAANEDHLQKDAEQMYKTADRFIELQLTSQLSSVNIDSDTQEPATQKMHLSSSTKSSKSLRRQSRSSADLLALNYFEQKEIDDLAKAYDTAFGNEKSAKVIHKPKTIQELMYNPDVYIRRTITFCQHFSGYNALSDAEKMLILKPFVFEATTVKFAFSFHPDAKSVSVFSDNSGEEVYEVDLYFGKELISDHTAPEENMRCGFAIRRSMCGDENLRNLFTAQMLFQPREGIVGEGCGGLLGNSEFMRYHFTYYSKLLQRYLESKYRSEEKAERKYADLEGHRTHTMDIIKNNRKKILDQFEGKIELPEIIQELKLSSVNTGSDSKPATQKQLSITKFNKSPSPPHNQNSPETHLLALNAFEQKEIDALATAYETAFGNELTAKVIQKPQTVQQLLYNPDVYIRRAIAFCQHFAGFKDLSEPQKVLILKPFVFEVITLKFVFTFDPEYRLVTVFSDNSGEEVYEVDQSFCMKYITDQSVPEENTRCSSEIRKSLDGDSNLRNLLSAQMLFQPRERVSVGNLEFLHYHFTYYSQLLQRYLESKYSSEEQAAEQGNFCIDHQRNGVRVFANNEADEVIFYNFNLGDQIKHSEAWKSMASYGKLLSLAMEDDPMIRDLLTAQQLFAPTPIRAGEGDPRLTLSCPEYVHYQRSLYLGLLRRYLQIKYRSKAVAMRKYYSLLELINRLTTYKETEIYLYQAEFGDLMQLSALELEIPLEIVLHGDYATVACVTREAYIPVAGLCLLSAYILHRLYLPFSG